MFCQIVTSWAVIYSLSPASRHVVIVAIPTLCHRHNNNDLETAISQIITNSWRRLAGDKQSCCIYVLLDASESTDWLIG